MQPLINDLHDRVRCRIVVVGLAAVDRVRRRERHHAGLGINQPARQAKPVHVPWRLGAAAAFDPSFRCTDELGGRHHRIDELHALGLRQPDLVALEQELQRVTGLHHARHALRATGTWKESDLDLGQAHARLGIVRRHPVMAGKAELEAAAERGAVDGRDPGLAARFQPPVEL